MKKRLSIIVAMCFMLLIPNISVQAASNLKISGQTLPSTINVGSYFDCKGKITSDYTLTAVTGAIYSVDLKTTYCTKTVDPKDKSYSLYGSKIDMAMTFNKLTTGTYIYRITAKDSSGTSKNLINQQFNVGSPASTLSISGQTEPTNIKSGSCFDCKGTITSNYSITNVTGGIYSADMKKTYYSKSVAPNALSYSIRGGAIDMALLFNKLSIGTYLYTVTALDASGKSIVAINKNFTVNGGANTTTKNVVTKTTTNITNNVKKTLNQSLSELSISGASKPTKIYQGNCFDCKGKITSNYKITEVIGQITSADGKDILYNKKVNPQKKTYSLAGGKIDTALLFNKLKKGNYVYKIIAKDETGNKIELVNCKFEVKTVEFTWPTDSKGKSVTQKYGWKGNKLHYGIDIAGKGCNGKNIYSAESGVVVAIGNIKKGYGNYIVIRHYNGYYTLYAHCSKVLVKTKKKVERGAIIGKIGSTGYSTGPHLHFEVRKDESLHYDETKKQCKEAEKHLYNPLNFEYTYK